MYFDVRRSDRDGWSVVTVVGEVDLATVPAYRAELIAATTGAAHVAIDLSACDLIDSVGLGVTLGGARRMGPGGRFVVVTGPRTRHAFERCRLDEILTLVDAIDVLEPVRRAPTGGADVVPTVHGREEGVVADAP